MAMIATRDVSVEAYRFDGDGRFPNSAMPVLVYRGAVPNDPDVAEAILIGNRWRPAWRGTIGFYPFDHFHGNAHELVAIVAGEDRKSVV